MNKQWLEVIFRSRQFKEFALTWEVETTDDIKDVENLEIEFIRNGWQVEEKSVESNSCRGCRIKIKFRRIGHNTYIG